MGLEKQTRTHSVSRILVALHVLVHLDANDSFRPTESEAQLGFGPLYAPHRNQLQSKDGQGTVS
jgi:hypothetical protein